MIDPFKVHKCLLCGGETRLRSRNLAGYVVGHLFQVWNCISCDASHVLPMEIDQNIYNSIYEHADQIEGYCDYFKFAKEIRDQPDPVGYLSTMQDVYWSIISSVVDLPSAAEVVEIGSGLGYLTYALRCHGVNITGLDISKHAVDLAVDRFGPYFLVGDLNDWSCKYSGKFDAVIMAELIEHVTDPYACLENAARMLKPGGKLIVTTPNRSFFPRWSLWETEAPPVHLWWFSETAMIKIAERLDVGIKFVDFSEYNELHGEPYSRPFNSMHSNFGPMLSESHDPLSHETKRMFARSRRPLLYRLYKIKNNLIKQLKCINKRVFGLAMNPRRPVLCAVMTKK